MTCQRTVAEAGAIATIRALSLFPHAQVAQFSTVTPEITPKSPSFDTMTQLGNVRAIAPIRMSIC